jgi:chromosome segregation ATPase
MNIQKIKDLRRRQRDLNSASINSLEIYRQCKSSDAEVQKLCKVTNNLEFQMNKVQTKMKIIEDKLDSIVHLLSEVKLKNEE